MIFSIALEPCPAHAVAQVDAIGEHGKRGGVEVELAVFSGGGLGPLERATLKALGVDPESGPIPVEEFEQIARAVDEDEDSTAAGIVTEAGDDLRVEPVEGLSHVAGFEGEEHAQAAGECQHGRRKAERSSAAHGRAAREATSITAPQGNEMRRAAVGGGAGPSRKISANAGCAVPGSPGFCRRLRNQAMKV